MSTLAACTIVAKNYLPFARVLARSFAEHHPGGRFFTLLIDRNEGYFEAENEPFTVVEVEELESVPDLDQFLFKYTILESSTAIKPYFLEYLFERYDLANLVYFDPDILILDSLDELAELVDRHSIVLTPHLTDPVDDDAHPGELAILQSGVYNLGFLALRRSEVSERMLRWWQERLYDQCLVRVERGLFVDQKWMNLVPTLFGDFHALRHPGYNVAYWNLHGRTVSQHNGGYRSNGEPLVFFHFSGIQPDNMEQVSKYQDRFVLRDLGEAARLYRRYRDRLYEAGFQECRGWPFAFGHFSDGVAIPDGARALYHSLAPDRRRRFGDPFDAAGDGSFFRWLNEPASGRRRKPPYLTRLLALFHGARSELQEAFPDVEGADFPAFCSWLADYGRYELRLDEAFLGTIHRESRATQFTVGGFKRRLENRLKRLYQSEAAKRMRWVLKRRLGRQRAAALRQRLRPSSASDIAGATPAGHRLRAPSRLEHLGINLIGYLQAETGMGEAARSLARALETTEVPVSLHSLDLNVLARREDPTYAAVESTFPHDVNLLVVNADQVRPVWDHLGADVLGGRYNVGFWLWELETFPETYRSAFDVLHEIWTPSSFCVEAISRISPVPVRRLPLPVAPLRGERFDRGHFGLPEGAFVFFFMFNFLSYFERKNPLAVVRAFRRAFGEGDDVLLLLKSSQSDFAPEALEALEREIDGAGRIRLIDEYLSRDEIHSLTALSDAYVSLHRSEGFGLTLAKAMHSGKPVVATPYSGNADFFNLNNGYPVEYRLVELVEDAGPYPAGGRWAEPDGEHAARQMRAVFDDPERRRTLSERARSDVERELGLEAVGRRLSERFHEILRQAGRDAIRRPHPT